jgi:hypothetical protein
MSEEMGLDMTIPKDGNMFFITPFCEGQPKAKLFICFIVKVKVNLLIKI